MAVMMSLGVTSGFAAGTPHYLPNGVYFEVESQDAVGRWKLQTKKDGYFGTGYFIDAGSGSGGHLEYTFEITEPGKYVGRIHGRRDRGDTGCPSDAPGDECNDVKSWFDNGTKEKTMVKASFGKWHWDGRYDRYHSGGGLPYMSHDLSAGTHTFNILPRSSGVKIDAIFIQKQGKSIQTPYDTPIANSLRYDFSTSVPKNRQSAVYTIKGERLGSSDMIRRLAPGLRIVRYSDSKGSVESILLDR